MHLHQYIGKKNPFNEGLFDKYDIPAREKIKNILKEFVIDNPDIYAQDLIITDPTCKYKYLELQVCATWVGDKYPFDKIFVYERKRRYNNDTLFLTLSKHFDKGYIFDADSFKDAPPRRIKKYSREFVYDVPWNKVMHVYVDNLEKEEILMY